MPFASAKAEAKEGLQWDDVENSLRLAFLYLERRPTKVAGHQEPRKSGLTGSPGPRLRDASGKEFK